MGWSSRTKTRFSVVELVFGVTVFGAVTLGLASFGAPVASDPAAALPTVRERDLASDAAREHMAAIMATPFDKIPEAYGEAGAARSFDVHRLSPATPGQPVGSTEVKKAKDEELQVTVRVVWLTKAGSADRLELQGTVAPPPLEKASTAAAVSVAAPPHDLPFDIDAMTLISAGWMSLVGLVLIGALCHRRPCTSTSEGLAL